MKVKLVKDHERQGRVKVVAKRGRTPTAFFTGAEVEVSEATGAKWIAAGKAVAVTSDAKNG